MILFSKTIGTGQDLVILHGLFGSSDNWQSFARSISEQFKVTMIDLRNHGRSLHTDEFSYALMSEDLEDTLKSLGIASCILLGHSMGGKTAAYFALHYPHRVRSLWIIDIAMRVYPPHHQIYFDGMLSLDLQKTSSRNEADAHLQMYNINAAERQFILKNLVRDTNNLFTWRMNIAALYTHYDQINISITADHAFNKPVYLIKGGLSNYIRHSDLQEIKKIFPQTELFTLENAGHWVHADALVELKELIKIMELSE